MRHLLLAKELWANLDGTVTTDAVTLGITFLWSLHWKTCHSVMFNRLLGRKEVEGQGGWSGHGW